MSFGLLGRMQMADYFLINYARLEHGFIFLTANYFIAAGVPFVLTDFGKPLNIRKLAFVFLWTLACIATGELVSAVYHIIDDTDRLTPFVVSVFVTAIYALAVSRVKMPVRLMRAASYVGVSSLVICITSSLGGVLGLEFSYLQWLLISANLIMICSGTLFLKYFSAEQGLRLNYVIPAIVVCANALCMAFVVIVSMQLIQFAAALILSLLLMFADLLAYMQVLRGHGEYEKLGKYFADMSDNVASTVDYTDCGNSTVNAIIAAEQSRVSRAGAELACRIAVPHEMNISDVDLCSLIMNLINNAAEYLERKPELSDRRIELEMTMSGHTLFAKVTNALADGDAERALSLQTNKPDRRYHGCGTRIVRRFSEKYGGLATFGEKNGRFVVAATLPEPPKATGEG